MKLNQAEIVKRKYDRFARYYDFFESFFESKFFRIWRKDLLSSLKGKILEIGVGTGKNLEFYNKEADVTGIDISPKMLEKAVEKQKKLKRNFNLLLMDAQNLNFENNSFDHVVCTFVLCSVPDPVKVLTEMKRVLKKEGTILMLEHMLSKNKIIAFLEHLHNPITKWLVGVNINRKTTENIRKSGLRITKEINLKLLDVFRRIEARKD